MRDPRYDVLFEPVRIGPVTTRNRFYQVPHCNGMGHLQPQALAAMRGVEGRGRLGRGLHRGGGDQPASATWRPTSRVASGTIATSPP